MQKRPWAKVPSFSPVLNFSDATMTEKRDDRGTRVRCNEHTGRAKHVWLPCGTSAESRPGSRTLPRLSQLSAAQRGYLNNSGDSRRTLAWEPRDARVLLTMSRRSQTHATFNNMPCAATRLHVALYHTWQTHSHPHPQKHRIVQTKPSVQVTRAWSDVRIGTS